MKKTHATKCRFSRQLGYVKTYLKREQVANFNLPRTFHAIFSKITAAEPSAETVIFPQQSGTFARLVVYHEHFVGAPISP